MSAGRSTTARLSRARIIALRREAVTNAHTTRAPTAAAYTQYSVGTKAVSSQPKTPPAARIPIGTHDERRVNIWRVDRHPATITTTTTMKPTQSGPSARAFASNTPETTTVAHNHTRSRPVIGVVNSTRLEIQNAAPAAISAPLGFTAPIKNMFIGARMNATD